MNRAAIITAIFGQATLPTVVPTVTTGVAGPMGAVANAASCDELTTATSGAMGTLNHKSYRYHSAVSGHAGEGNLAIIHQGHNMQPANDGIKPLVEAALAESFDVVWVGMTGFTPNGNGPDATIHNTYSGLQYFFMPPLSIINLLASSYGEIYMAGVSGGGYTTHVMGAIDPRIIRSAGVGNALPRHFYTDNSHYEWQGVTSVVDTNGLFLLAALEAGRKHRHYCLRFDPDNIPTPRYDSFKYYREIVNPIRVLLSTVNGGSFEWHEDWTTNIHHISDFTRNSIIEFFGGPVVTSYTLNAPVPPAAASLQFSKTGSGWLNWGSDKTNPVQGVNNDVFYCPAGTGTNVATWTLGGVGSGLWNIEASWSPYTGRATNAPYRIYADGTLVATFRVNQQTGSLPYYWSALGQVILPSSNLNITLADDANGYVIADAVRITRM